jgi:hypothetical protein
MSRGLAPNGSIRPWALPYEVQKPVVPALRALRLATGARGDWLDALSFPVAQQAVEIGSKRLALLTPRQVLPDLLEVRRKPGNRRGVYRELHTCILHARDLNGKPRWHAICRSIPHSKKQTTSGAPARQLVQDDFLQ